MKRLLCLALVAGLFTVTGLGCDKGSTASKAGTTSASTGSTRATGATGAAPK